MSSDPYVCVLDPDTKTTLKVYLYKNVQNVDEIRSNIISGAWNCAVVKPSLILDPLQIAVAANKAVVAETHHSLITKTVYSEILYNLSLSKNISQSLSTFGIEKDQDMLVCFLVRADRDDSQKILREICGEVCPLSEMPALADAARLRRAYKLRAGDALDAVLTKMVTKQFVAH